MFFSNDAKTETLPDGDDMFIYKAKMEAAMTSDLACQYLNREISLSYLLREERKLLQGFTYPAIQW